MRPESLLGSGGSVVTSSSTTLMRFVYGVLRMMGMFITAYHKTDMERDKFSMENKEPPIHPVKMVDFIIVGGGTAGALLGNRLSVQGKYKVLILEAGGSLFPLQSIPGLAPYMMMGPRREIDWAYQTVPQQHACQSLVDKRANICLGKGVGGSSNLGFLNYIRGSPFDYQNWANLTQDPGWKYSSLLPYFKRFENYGGPWSTDPVTHGFDGEFSLQSPNYTGLADTFIRAGMESKYRFTDLNGFYAEGFDYVLSPLTSRGYRQSSVNAFLHAGKKRNLDIKKFAEVKRILFHKESNSSTPRAYGVVYSRHGKLVMAMASKEVILCAGTINTPKLLMASGIGPKEVLKSLKVSIVKVLPDVGRNLQDHLITYLGPLMVSNSSFLLDRDVNARAIAQFGMSEGQGLLTSTGLHANGILVSSGSKMKGNFLWPNLHLSLYGMSHHQTFDSEFSSMYNLDQNVSSSWFNPTKGKDSFSIILSLGRPLSRGVVKMENDSSVLIDPRYLSNPGDMEVLLEGVQQALRLVEESKAFAEIGASLNPLPFPPCASLSFRSKGYWKCYIRHLSMSGNDLVGTCSMGKAVDSELRVQGVDRLRIIDASVIPSIPVGGTLAPTLVVAEKGADLILSHWDADDKIVQDVIPTSG